MTTAQTLIDTLGLTPHPEGGAFAETYRAPYTLRADAGTPPMAGPRAASTAIYFMLQKGEVSRLHRIASDEVWHFYAGHGLRVFVLDEAGPRTLALGLNLAAGERPQAVVPAGAWFGAMLAPDAPDGGYALVGCTVAPGFDFADFELADSAQCAALRAAHPDAAATLARLGPQPVHTAAD